VFDADGVGRALGAQAVVHDLADLVGDVVVHDPVP
jgi:hypothetical protein